MKLANLYIGISFIGSLLFTTSCDDQLDNVPPSSVTPENYLWEESQLEAYSINQYGTLPVKDPFDSDNQTDIQAGISVPGKYVAGEWKVPATGGSC